jgi:hypothetical protein
VAEPLDKDQGMTLAEPALLPSPPALLKPLAPAPLLDFVRSSLPMSPPPAPPIVLGPGLALLPAAVSDMLRRMVTELSLWPVR